MGASSGALSQDTSEYPWYLHPMDHEREIHAPVPENATRAGIDHSAGLPLDDSLEQPRLVDDRHHLVAGEGTHEMRTFLVVVQIDKDIDDLLKGF